MKRKPVLIIAIFLLSAFLLLGSQNYTADVYDAGHVAATDLQNMENNFDALKTNFSGTSAPSNPSALQWWADTSNNILKFRNEANSAWLDFFDFSSGVFVAGTDSGRITAAMISDSARKPSLVTGQTITPANCNPTSGVNAPSGTFTTLSATNFVAPYSVVASLPSDVAVKSTTNTTATLQCRFRVYISSQATYLRMSARLRSNNSAWYSYARFTINGTNSTTISRNSTTYAWVDNAYLNVSSLSGYYEVLIYLYSSTTNNTAYLDGLTLFVQ